MHEIEPIEQTVNRQSLATKGKGIISPPIVRANRVLINPCLTTSTFTLRIGGWKYNTGRIGEKCTLPVFKYTPTLTI